MTLEAACPYHPLTGTRARSKMSLPRLHEFDESKDNAGQEMDVPILLDANKASCIPRCGFFMRRPPTRVPQTSLCLHLFRWDDCISIIFTLRLVLQTSSQQKNQSLFLIRTSAHFSYFLAVF